MRLGRYTITDSVPAWFRDESRREARGLLAMLVGDRVCRAVSDDGREVAIKVGYVERIEVEVAALSRVRHENVIELLDHGPAWYAMPRAMHAIRDERLDHLARLDVFRDACRGVIALHTAGVVHGDIHDGNVLRMPDGRVVIADLNCASLDAVDRAGNVVRMRTGAITGMDPSRDIIDPTVDVHGLGVMLHRWCGDDARLTRIAARAIVERHRRFWEPRVTTTEAPFTSVAELLAAIES